MKSWAQSRTIAAMAIGALIMVLGSNELANVIPQAVTNYIALAIFILGIALRFVTSEPVSKPLGGSDR